MDNMDCKKVFHLFVIISLMMYAVLYAQVPLGKMTAFWRTCMMTGGKDQEEPWHLYENPVAYLDQTDFPYNYSKYGYTPDDAFVLHADRASFVRFLSTGKSDKNDLAERVDGKIILRADRLRKRFAKTEAAGTIKNYILVLDNIPFCFPRHEDIRVETYGQTALPADMDEWVSFISDLCLEIKDVLGEEKADHLIFRMGTEAHDGERFHYDDPNVMINFYKMTAEAVKTVLPGAEFGPYNSHTPWQPDKQILKFPDLVRYCMKYDLPLDFIGYSWYVQGEKALTDPSSFISHWENAVSINSDLIGVPKEYHEFGSLGLRGNKYVRPSCDNAAAIFNMLMDSKAGGLTGIYHWPVDVKIADSPSKHVLNALGWVFQVLDHTTGGDSYLLDTKSSHPDYGSQIRALGALNCDNNNSYLLISSFNTDIEKSRKEIVTVRMPIDLVEFNINQKFVKAAVLDRSNCPLLAIRNDLQAAGYVSSEYVSRPNVTLYFPVHYVFVHGSLTNAAAARKYLSLHRQKYADLCSDSLTYKHTQVSIAEEDTNFVIKIPVRANSISVIDLQRK